MIKYLKIKKKNIILLQKYCRIRKRFIWRVLIFLFIFDLFLGLLDAYARHFSSSKNKFTMLKLEQTYKMYYIKTNRFIAKWNDVYDDKTKSLPYQWNDRDYEILAPASINYIRKLLYKKKAAYLLFNMNEADESIKNDPNTIIIASPYPYKGRRRVYTVNALKGLSGERKYWVAEEDFQKQLQRQKWFPKVEIPPED